MNKKNLIKICISTVAISIVFMYASVDYLLFTNFARNTFFYADYFVADQIISSGSIPESGDLTAPNQWGKINALLKLPLQPLFLAVIKLVSGIPYRHTYTRFPSWLLIMSAFYILLRQMGLPLFSRTLLSIAAGIATPVSAHYPIALFSSVKGIMFLSVAVLSLHILSSTKNNGDSINKAAFGLIISIFLLFMFYWDPEKYFIVALIIAITGAILYIKGHKMALYLSIVTFSVLVFLQVFELPLAPYIAQLRSAILSVITLEFSNPVSTYTGGSTEGGTSSRGYYSLLPLIVIFPLATVGGIYALLDLKNEDSHTSIIAVSWGIAAFCFSLLYMISASGWLSGRSYFFALPVLFLGCARYISTRENWVQVLTSGVILILVFSSIILQLGTPLIHLHNYEPGIESGSDWASEHIEGPIITDHKVGAPIAANGNFNAEYPRTANKTNDVFYPEDYQVFVNSVNNPVIFSKGMKRYGVRAKSPQGPISSDTFNNTINRSDKPFSNGEIIVVIPNPR